MSAEVVANLDVVRMARTLGGLNYRVVRVYPNDKRPVGLDWPRQATDNVDVLTNQFSSGPFNIGVACGPQPNGKNLVAIDVDTRDDGLLTWANLVAEHEAFTTAQHTTPSGGLHVFFDAGALEVRNGRLAPGIDIRGEGGQVLVPPSSRIIDGAVVGYGERFPRSGIHRHPIAEITDWLAAMMVRPSPIIESVARHPSQGVTNNADWLGDHWDWLGTLEAQGYDIVGRTSDGVLVRHPTATAEHSAQVHLDENWMCAYSTNMPEALRDRQINRDGSISWTPFDWFTATQHGGDYSAATREINGRRGLLGPSVVTTPAAGDADAATMSDATSPMRLPQVTDDYWSATPWKEHIRQAAWNRRVSPDALDLAMYALVSCLIPPNYMIESPVGPQPLNMLACLVASTGDFKTNTLGAGLDLLGPFPPWVDTIGMGTGEGIGAMFLKEEEVEDAKGKKTKTGAMVRNDLRAVFFEADEGSGLSKQAGRQGATIIANLCKAWSGSMLGEGNASLATRRRVLRNDYRIGAYVNIQPSNFGLLFSEANTGTGLTGRFMFSGTLDSNMPDERPPWPGQMEFPAWTGKPLLITLDPALLAAADDSVVQRHRTGGLTTANPLAQVAATTARIAALNALVEDRYHVTADDFALARVRAETSAGALTVLDHYFGQVRSDEGHKGAEAKAKASAQTKEAEDRIWLKKATDRVMALLLEGPTSSGHIQARLSANQRPYLEQALVSLTDIGQIRLVGERYERT